MASDDALRERWGRFQLASAALRRDLPPAVDLGLAERLAASLEQPNGVAKLAVEPRRSWYRPAAGFTVAASVAAIALLGVELSSEPELGAPTTKSQLAPLVGTPATAVVQPLVDSPRQSETLTRATSEAELRTRMQGLLYLHAGQVPGSLFGDTRMVAYEGQR
jgi:negative regulator of sigma E activity